MSSIEIVMSGRIRFTAVLWKIITIICFLFSLTEVAGEEQLVQLVEPVELEDGVVIPKGSVGTLHSLRNEEDRQVAMVKWDGLRYDEQGDHVEVDFTQVERVSRMPGVTSKEEVQQVKCQVCKLLLKEARQFAKTGAFANVDIASDVVENLCSPSTRPGRWLKALDLIQEGGRLKVLPQNQFGECRRECSTAQRACRKSLEGHEDYFLSKAFWSSDGFPAQDDFCGKACERPPKPLSGRRQDEIFQASKRKNAWERLDARNAGSKIIRESSVEDFEALSEYFDSEVLDENLAGLGTVDSANVPPLRIQDLLDANLLETIDAQAPDSNADQIAQVRSEVEERSLDQEAEHVECEVCDIFVTVLSNMAVMYVSSGSTFVVENICEPTEPEGFWINWLDLQTNGSSIIVVPQDRPGVCNRECLVVKRACESIVVMKSWEKASPKEHSDWCKMSCMQVPKPLKYKRVDDAFQALEKGSWGISPVKPKHIETIIETMPTESTYNAGKSGVDVWFGMALDFFVWLLTSVVLFSLILLSLWLSGAIDTKNVFVQGLEMLLDTLSWFLLIALLSWLTLGVDGPYTCCIACAVACLGSPRFAASLIMKMYTSESLAELRKPIADSIVEAIAEIKRFMMDRGTDLVVTLRIAGHSFLEQMFTSVSGFVLTLKHRWASCQRILKHADHSTTNDEVAKSQKQLQQLNEDLQLTLERLERQGRELASENDARKNAESVALQFSKQVNILEQTVKEERQARLQAEASAKKAAKELQLQKEASKRQSKSCQEQLEELTSRLPQERIDRLAVEQAKKEIESEFQSQHRVMQTTLNKTLEYLSELMDSAPEEEQMLSVLRRMWQEHSAFTPPHEIKVMDVSALSYTHDSISQRFRDGRSLENLVDDLHAGRVVPSKHSNLLLDVVSFRGGYRCLNNRRLWALKKYQKDLQLGTTTGKKGCNLSKPINVRVRIFNPCPVTAKFVLSNTTCTDGAEAEVRRSVSCQPRSLSRRKVKAAGAIPCQRRTASHTPASGTNTHASGFAIGRRWDQNREPTDTREGVRTACQVVVDEVVHHCKRNQVIGPARNVTEIDLQHRPSGAIETIAPVWEKFRDPVTSKDWWWNERERRAVWEDPLHASLKR